MNDLMNSTLRLVLYARDKHFEDKNVPAFIQSMSEKFAELIVKECVTICTPDISGRLDGRPYETADDFDRGFIDGQDCCVELIKRQFGVDNE